MAKDLSPINSNKPITPTMVTAARKCLGSCHQAASKISTFEGIGLNYEEQKQIENDLRRIAESVIAAWEMQEMQGANNNGYGT